MLSYEIDQWPRLDRLDGNTATAPWATYEKTQHLALSRDNMISQAQHHVEELQSPGQAKKKKMMLPLLRRHKRKKAVVKYILISTFFIVMFLHHYRQLPTLITMYYWQHDQEAQHLQDLSWLGFITIVDSNTNSTTRSQTNTTGIINHTTINEVLEKINGHVRGTTRRQPNINSANRNGIVASLIINPFIAAKTTSADMNKKTTRNQQSRPARARPSTARDNSEKGSDVPPPGRAHPHAGARYPNGTWGYVPDATKVRRWMIDRYHQHHSHTTTTTSTILSSTSSPDMMSYLPWMSDNEFNEVCYVPVGLGYEGVGGWDILANKVVVDGPDPIAQHDNRNSSNSRGDGIATTATARQRPYRKLLCAVYTHGANHGRVTAITETWGWRCDGFFAASTETVVDPSAPGFGAVDLPHHGPETYGNMWQKTRSIMAYMYDNYLDDYEYFVMTGDDTHIIVENLRNTLSQLEENEAMAATTASSETMPMYLGHLIPGDLGLRFVGGGAGVVINRAALQLMVNQTLPNCLPTKMVSSEDRFLGMCMKRAGVQPIDTADAAGEQRFHGMDPHWISRYDPRETNRTEPVVAHRHGGGEGKADFFRAAYRFWAKTHGYKVGKDLVSTQSVSFHILRTPVDMKRHHAILYKESCPKESLLGQALLSKGSGSGVLV